MKKTTKKSGVWWNACRAFSARFLFILHTLVAVWRVAWEYGSSIYYCLLLPVTFSLLESCIRTKVNRSAESRWFCLSVALYLGSVVPSIWLLQLKMTSEIVGINGSCQEKDVAGGPDFHKTDYNDFSNSNGTTELKISLLDEILGVNSSLNFVPPVKIVIPIDEKLWMYLVEQTLLVVLIIGRWLMPSRGLSADHVSQLLLVWLAVGADIVDLFDTLKECTIFSQLRLTLLVLVVWTSSLLQFPIQITGTSRKARSMSTKTKYTSIRKKTNLMQPNNTKSFYYYLVTNLDFWSIMVTTVFQDGPFLSLRLYLMVKYNLQSYTMIYFTCKNTLVVLLQMYRLYGICVAIKEEKTAHVIAQLCAPSPEDPSYSNRGDRFGDVELSDDRANPVPAYMAP